MDYKEKTFENFDKYQEHYFPKSFEERKIREMTSKEFGKYCAKKSVEKLRKNFG